MIYAFCWRQIKPLGLMGIVSALAKHALLPQWLMYDLWACAP
jgi:hypothetical protein